jgi:hypothetical protein
VIAAQVVPPSDVRSSEGQRPAEQGALPSTQPSCTDTKVTEAAANPRGTVPPEGPDGVAGRPVAGARGAGLGPGGEALPPAQPARSSVSDAVQITGRISAVYGPRSAGAV